MHMSKHIDEQWIRDGSYRRGSSIRGKSLSDECSMLNYVACPGARRRVVDRWMEAAGRHERFSPASTFGEAHF